MKKAPERATSGAAATPLLLRLREVAGLLSVSERQVWSLIRAGELAPIRPPGIRVIRVAREDVLALVRRWRTAEESAGAILRPEDEVG